MKTTLAAFAIATILSAAPETSAQSGGAYVLQSSVVAGGTSSSAGGSYSLSATIGQSDAGTRLTGGAYSLTGGFWVLPQAIATPGAPSLSITRGNNNSIVVSWPSQSKGFVLQQTLSDLASTNWSNANGTVQDDGIRKSMVFDPALGIRFFRLFKP